MKRLITTLLALNALSLLACSSNGGCGCRRLQTTGVDHRCIGFCHHLGCDGSCGIPPDDKVPSHEELLGLHNEILLEENALMKVLLTEKDLLIVALKEQLNQMRLMTGQMEEP